MNLKALGLQIHKIVRKILRSFAPQNLDFFGKFEAHRASNFQKKVKIWRTKFFKFEPRPKLCQGGKDLRVAAQPQPSNP